MGCRIILGREHYESPDVAVLFCSTTGVAFGPVITEAAGYDAEEVAERFIKWLEDHPTEQAVKGNGPCGLVFRCTTDPRRYSVSELMDLYAQFRRQLETPAPATNEPLPF